MLRKLGGSLVFCASILADFGKEASEPFILASFPPSRLKFIPQSNIVYIYVYLTTIRPKNNYPETCVLQVLELGVGKRFVPHGCLDH